jgi:kynureninase
MNGTLHVPAPHAARPGLKIIYEVGVERIREKSQRQTAMLMAMAVQRAWRVSTPRDPARRGGTVSIDMPNSQQVAAELIKRNILVDWRPNAGVRFAPHFYNNDEELKLAIGAVDEILALMRSPAR